MASIARCPLGLLAVALIVTVTSSGCQWYDSLRGDGFPQSTNNLGTGVRGSDPSVQPSGFFTDRRSDQIERNLGGGF